MVQNLENYKKIYIIGACGSGKTTFAKKLSEQLGIPYFSLDNIYRFEKSRKIRPDTKRTDMLNDIFRKKSWIIEGAHAKEWTAEIWEHCDVVIFCNPSAIKRIYFLIKRYATAKRIKGQTYGDILHNALFNIRITLQFKKQDLLKFQEFKKQYKQTPVIDSAKKCHCIEISKTWAKKAIFRVYRRQ